jgi:hypothetical protein
MSTLRLTGKLPPSDAPTPMFLNIESTFRSVAHSTGVARCMFTIGSGKPMDMMFW